MLDSVRSFLACALLLPASLAFAAETPQRGGILTYAIGGAPATFDCAEAGTGRVIQAVAPFYSLLLRFDPVNYPKIESDVADSWTVSPDKLTYTFTLHPNVKFHDGSELTSADVKATYDRLRAPPPGVTSLRQSSFAAISSIDTPDPRTVVFHLSRTDPTMLLVFADPYNCLYSAKKLAQNPKYPQTEIMGSGPFMFGEYVPGASLTGKRFDGYFRPGQPYLDGIKQLYLTGAGMTNALTGGQADANFSTLLPQDRELLRSSRGVAMTFPEAPYNIINFITVNNKKPPFDDVRVRRALSLALDRKTGAALLERSTNYKGTGDLLPPGSDMDMSPAELAKLPGLGPDIAANRAEAKKLLAEAGQSNLHLTLLNRNVGSPPIGVILLDQWRQIGVTADQVLADNGPYFQRLSSGNYDVAIDFFGPATNDPSQALVKFLPDSPLNYTGAKDSELQGLYDRQAAEADPAKRRDLVTQFQKRVIEQAYVVPTFSTTNIAAVASKIKGWQITPSTAINMDMGAVWLDK